MTIQTLRGALVILVALAASINVAAADQLLGSYVARLSDNDHHASDGYALDTAAQVVRQDRANWHKFGSGDPEDEGDDWFGSTSARARFEKLLNQNGAISRDTRNAIMNGTPVVEVSVYRSSVRVKIVGY